MTEVVRSGPAHPVIRTVNRKETGFAAGARNTEQEKSRIRKLNASRTSLRIWPITRKNPTEISTSLKEFITKNLNINREDVSCLGIRWVERLRSPAKSNIKEEVRVSFSSVFFRDEMASKGKPLAGLVNESGAPTGGFRLDVPDYLAGDIKTLNDFGFRMRRVHGRQTRKYIKYDADAYGSQIPWTDILYPDNTRISKNTQ